MNESKVTQIKKTSAIYYVVGIFIFSAIAGIIALIVEIVKQNSWWIALGSNAPHCHLKRDNVECRTQLAIAICIQCSWALPHYFEWNIFHR